MKFIVISILLFAFVAGQAGSQTERNQLASAQEQALGVEAQMNSVAKWTHTAVRITPPRQDGLRDIMFLSSTPIFTNPHESKGAWIVTSIAFGVAISTKTDLPLGRIELADYETAEKYTYYSIEILTAKQICAKIKAANTGDLQAAAKDFKAALKTEVLSHKPDPETVIAGKPTKTVRQAASTPTPTPTLKSQLHITRVDSKTLKVNGEVCKIKSKVTVGDKTLQLKSIADFSATFTDQDSEEVYGDYERRED